jgi:SRSO17 transposase
MNSEVFTNRSVIVFSVVISEHISFYFMVEPFSAFERKTIEPIALSLSYGHVRALQRFVSDAPWDEEVMIAKYRGLAKDNLSSPDGTMILGEIGFVKKGQDFIGVAKQYCKTIGKVNNCRVGVFAA